MKIIVGLGNPGNEYQKTRHNTGWLVVEKIIKNLKLKNQNYNFKFKNIQKLLAEICEIIYDEKKIFLVKPQTFMNTSGVAVKKILQYNNVTTRLPAPSAQADGGQVKQWSNGLWVIHDDLDLPLGTLRIVQNRGSAGHKGIQSVIKELGTKDFVRFRVGVGRKGFVLDEFRGEEKKVFESMIEKTAEAVLYALDHGIEAAMNKYN